MKWYGQFDPPTDSVIRGYFDPSYKGAAIEVGAVDGIFFSNTYALEVEGWLCLAIEANPENYSALMRNRKHAATCACGLTNGEAALTIYDIRQPDHTACTSINPDPKLVAQYSAQIVRKVTVNVRTLDDCIERFGKFQKIDVVSIDTEGTELDVLLGFDVKKWNPTLIVTEDNHGDNLPLARHLENLQYHRHRRHGVNDFWVSRDYYNLKRL